MELTERVDWQATPGEEIVSLPFLGALVAPRDPGRGRDAFEHLSRESEDALRAIHLLWEGRRPALESFADATIAKARGNFEEALARYADSQKYWRGSEMIARAALTGLERFTMSRNDADLAPAADFLRRFPTTSFAKRLGKALERTATSSPGDFVFLNQGVSAAG